GIKIGASLSSNSRLLRADHWDAQEECRPLSYKSFVPHTSSHALYCLLYECQSQPCTRTFCGKIRLEQLFPCFRVYAFTVILNGYSHIMVRIVTNRDMNMTPSLGDCRLNGILDQVIERSQ